MDSTVVIGFLDGDDALHEESVAAVRRAARQQSLAASVITYAEVMTGVSRGHHPRERVEGFFDTVIRELLPVDKKTAACAASLRGGHRSLKMPDALILASADLHADVESILTGDDKWPKIPALRCKVELVEGAQTA